jgi:hypothetical protein
MVLVDAVGDELTHVLTVTEALARAHAHDRNTSIGTAAGGDADGKSASDVDGDVDVERDSVLMLHAVVHTASTNTDTGNGGNGGGVVYHGGADTNVTSSMSASSSSPVSFPGHAHVVLRGALYDGKGFVCSVCEQSIVDNRNSGDGTVVGYQCSRCEFDVCDLCFADATAAAAKGSKNATADAKSAAAVQVTAIVSGEAVLSSHPSHAHGLTRMLVYDGTGFSCSVCALLQSGDRPSHHCAACEYDVCDACMQAHRVVGRH